MTMRKTKIIATLGPATDDRETMRGLIEAGMNVARFNFSHGSHDDIKKRLEIFRSVCTELKANVAALADTKGPEVRLGVFDGGAATLVTGKDFRLTTAKCVGNAEKAFITYAGLPSEVHEGDRVDRPLGRVWP